MEINTTESIEQIDVCAPHKKFEANSCLSLESLYLIAEAYNKDNPDNIINLYTNYKILHPHKYKKYLVKELNKRLKNKCNNQQCWTKQSFMKHINNVNKEEIAKYTFRPVGPDGKFEWLNTSNIDNVLEQYELLYKDFKFLGTVPIDFDKLKFLGIKTLDFNKLIKENKTKLGIVFNLDEHWQSGSHWVAAYSDLIKGQIYYFDSYGTRPEKQIRVFMNRIYKFLKEELKMENIDIDYNKIRHQYKNSECGIYSTNFIIRLLRGDTFKEICESKIPDDRINKCREKYFNLNKKNN
jgi:hypothetical protein